MIGIKSIQGVNHEIQVKKFGEVNTDDAFFDSFRRYYSPYFEDWLKRKRLDPVYVAKDGLNRIIGFLKLKLEDTDEDYSDITPAFYPKKRLKISSFKVASHNYGLSDVLMDLAFSQAIFNHVDEIYGTIPKICDYKRDLENFIYKRGFVHHGVKVSHALEDDVYIKRILHPAIK